MVEIKIHFSPERTDDLERSPSNQVGRWYQNITLVRTKITMEHDGQVQCGLWSSESTACSVCLVARRQHGQHQRRQHVRYRPAPTCAAPLIQVVGRYSFYVWSSESRACSVCLLARPRPVPALLAPAPPARPPPASAAARRSTCACGTRFYAGGHDRFANRPARR